jgi:hypothetical protein
MMYKHTPTGAILRLPDMVEITQDSADADDQAKALRNLLKVLP